MAVLLGGCSDHVGHGRFGGAVSHDVLDGLPPTDRGRSGDGSPAAQQVRNFMFHDEEHPTRPVDITALKQPVAVSGIGAIGLSAPASLKDASRAMVTDAVGDP